MDEAHQIVLKALEQAAIVLPPAVDSLQDLTSSSLVSLCRQALALINGENANLEAASLSLPQPASERFRLCTDLAHSIKQLGYRGDLSFHQFLYPSEEESYKLLLFILNELSKSSTSTKRRVSRKSRGSKSAGVESSRTRITVKNTLSKWLQEASQSSIEGTSQSGRQTDDANDLLIPFRTCSLRLASSTTVPGSGKKIPPLITRQVKPRSWLVPSVLELNLKNALNAATVQDHPLAHLGRHAGDSTQEEAQNVRITSHGSLQWETNAEEANSSSYVEFGREGIRLLYDVSEEGSESNRHEDVSEFEIVEGEKEMQDVESAKLRKKLNHLQAEATEIVGETKKLESTVYEIKKEIEVGTEEVELLKQKLILKQAAADMALENTDSIDSVVNNLQSVIKDRHDQLANLKREWEAIQESLDERQTSLQTILDGRKDKVQPRLQQVKEIQQKMKELAIKIKQRDEQLSTLVMEVENAPKGPSRNTYVRRITELIKNSKKQDSDISHIIKEIRDLQRESNTNQGRLQRTYALVDELVFRDAKKDPLCRRAYILLSSIHENFADCFEKVFIMDKLNREIDELQATLEALEKSPVDLLKLQADLDAILAENEALEKKLEGFKILG